MKVKTTRQTFIGGVPVKAGKTLTVPKELSEADASSLIAGGKAVPVDDNTEDAAGVDREKDGSGENTK